MVNFSLESTVWKKTWHPEMFFILFILFFSSSVFDHSATANLHLFHAYWLCLTIKAFSNEKLKITTSARRPKKERDQSQLRLNSYFPVFFSHGTGCRGFKGAWCTCSWWPPPFSWCTTAACSSPSPPSRRRFRPSRRNFNKKMWSSLKTPTSGIRNGKDKNLRIRLTWTK